ncbi:MAG: hypothetical protein AAGA64_07410 [Bacteroidota bacterium]
MSKQESTLQKYTLQTEVGYDTRDNIKKLMKKYGYKTSRKAIERAVAHALYCDEVDTKQIGQQLYRIENIVLAILETLE